MKEIGLLEYIVELPYMGFLVRNLGSETRWASGKYHEKFKFFIKYQLEYYMSLKTSKFIKDSYSWRKYLTNLDSLQSLKKEVTKIQTKRELRYFRIFIDLIRYKNVRKELFAKARNRFL